MEKTRKQRIIFAFLLAFFWCFNLSAKILLIEDEETEQYLKQLILPIFKTAKIPYNQNKIHIIQDSSLNAFVSDGNHLFVHTGLILAANNSNELQGVLAHETGHIQMGHIFRQKIKAGEMATTSLVTTILAGAFGAVSGRADVGIAAILGSQSSIMSQYFIYRIEDERSADEAAIKLLEKNQQSSEGLLSFMKKLSKDNQLNGREENSYFRTHPINSERLAFLENQTKIEYHPTKNDNLQNIQAKLYAFLEKPEKTLLKYSDNKYAIAIAKFKQMKIDEAMQNLDSLIKENPQNPFLYELKGQVLFETGKVKQAISPYQKALEIMPNSPIFQTNLAMSIIESYNDANNINQAILLLKKSVLQKKSPLNYMLLAQAYGKIDNQENALLAAAEYSHLIGNQTLAKTQAKQVKKISNNPQTILRADDLLIKIESFAN